MFTCTLMVFIMMDNGWPERLKLKYPFTPELFCGRKAPQKESIDD